MIGFIPMTLRGNLQEESTMQKSSFSTAGLIIITAVLLFTGCSSHAAVLPEEFEFLHEEVNRETADLEVPITELDHNAD